MPKVHVILAEPRKPAEMYALTKTKPRVWLKLPWIHQKLVQFCQNPLNIWQFVAVISVYFRPAETPISAETEISPKPTILANAEPKPKFRSITSVLVLGAGNSLQPHYFNSLNTVFFSKSFFFGLDLINEIGSRAKQVFQVADRKSFDLLLM